MDRRPLGKTGIMVAPVGLGTVKIGRNTGVKYPKGFELPTDAEVEALLKKALELGVNVIDTAPAYGTSEARLAPFVKKHRKDIVLVTKCGEFHENGASRWDFSRPAIEAQVEASLKRLGTDHADVLLLHSDGSNPTAEETLLGLKKRGLARAVGISAKTGVEVSGAIDVVMAPFNRADAALEPTLRAAHSAGRGVLSIKAVEQGRAASPEAAIAFAAGQSFIDCVVVGTLSPAHLEAAVQAVEK